jgi:hypothetical protein
MPYYTQRVGDPAEIVGCGDRSRGGKWRSGGVAVLHVYFDRESQHRLMSCMRMKTYMKMVAV